MSKWRISWDCVTGGDDLIEAKDREAAEKIAWEMAEEDVGSQLTVTAEEATEDDLREFGEGESDESDDGGDNDAGQ